MEWASAEHQEFLFNYFHRGGKERAVNSIVGSAQQTIGAVSSIKGMVETMDKSQSIQAEAFQRKVQGTAAYMSGGLPAWQAHKMETSNWHLENAKFFGNQLNKSITLP